MSLRPLVSLAFAAALVAGCHSNKNKVDALDNSLVVNDADPALTGALNGQIMVDPALTQQANGAAVRPPAQPYSGETPKVAGADQASGDLRHAPPASKNCPACASSKGALTLGELARRQKGPGLGGCSADVKYSVEWVNRLGDLPVYPGAAVSEAAGSNHPGCALRIVSFATTASPSRVIDWYYTQATRAGYDGEQQSGGKERVLGGTRARDGGAYVVFVNPAEGGGSAVDLVVNNGR